MSGPIRLVPAHERILVYFGESTLAETKIGRVYATTRARVVVETCGRTFELTPAEAGALHKALFRGACAADRWGEHLAGRDRVRIQKVGDDFEATYRGETHKLTPRMSRTRSARCQVCRERRLGYYHCKDFVVVCTECVHTLAGEPSTLRDVTSGG